MQYNFEITDAAQKKLQKLLVDEPEGSKLRIEVLGGGCSGFQYKYSFDHSQNTEDMIFGESVVIDEVSIGLINDSKLDYEEDLGSAGFVIKNPNATAKCGCGNSFSV